jgi:hypothetical protein
MDEFNHETLKPEPVKGEGKTKDEFNYEPLKPEDIQIEDSNRPKIWLRQALIPGSIALIVIAAIGIYFLKIKVPEKLIAQPLEFNLIHDSATAVISITNQMDEQAVVGRMYPVYIGKGQSHSYAKSINVIMEGASLPLIILPNEMRIIQLKFQVDKKDLALYGDTLRDSSHVVMYHDVPLKGQLEGSLGIGWDVIDSEGKSYANNTRLVYYVLAPSPEGFKELKSFIRSGLLSEDPFELCVQEEVAGNK